MTTLTINIKHDTPEVMKTLDYLRNLSGVTITSNRRAKKTYAEAVKECNAISVDAFFDELDARLQRRYNHA